jgi:hypothetical protein
MCRKCNYPAGEFLQKLAKFVGRRDDLGDGELHRLCVAAPVTPPISISKVPAKI